MYMYTNTLMNACGGKHSAKSVMQFYRKDVAVSWNLQSMKIVVKQFTGK